MERRMVRAYTHTYVQTVRAHRKNERRSPSRWGDPPRWITPRFLGLEKRRGAGGHSERATPLSPDRVSPTLGGARGGGPRDN